MLRKGACLREAQGANPAERGAILPAAHRAPCLFIVAALVLAAAGHAQAGDGASFLRDCTAAIKVSEGTNVTEEDGLRGVSCASYLSGFMDSQSVHAGILQGPQVICLPQAGITNEQAVRVLVKYLRAFPERLHESGRSSTFTALATAFPCPK